MLGGFGVVCIVEGFWYVGLIGDCVFMGNCSVDVFIWIFGIVGVFCGVEVFVGVEIEIEVCILFRVIVLVCVVGSVEVIWFCIGVELWVVIDIVDVVYCCILGVLVQVLYEFVIGYWYMVVGVVGVHDRVEEVFDGIGVIGSRVGCCRNDI